MSGDRGAVSADFQIRHHEVARQTSLDAWVDRERARLMVPLERAAKIRANRERTSRPSQVSSLAKPFEAAAELGRQFEQMNAWTTRTFSKPEDRSPQEYRSAVAQYLADAREALPDVLVDRHMATNACSIELVAANPTDMPFRSVEFELYIPGDGFAALEGPSHHRLPTPPRMWGDRQRDVFDVRSLLSALDPVDFTSTDLGLHGAGEPWVDIENGGPARLRFSPLDLPRGRRSRSLSSSSWR